MSIFDRAKETAEKLVMKVRVKLDGHAERTDTVEGAAASGQSSAGHSPKTIPSDGAVTPADVAEAVNDPDLPHPEAGKEQ